MLKVKLHAKGIDSKFRMALRVCVEHTLKELGVSKRLRDRLEVSLHLLSETCKK